MSIYGTSRNNIHLNTGNDKDDHYDQICAISAATINENFKALFELCRGDMEKLLFNDGEHGTIIATLLPPKVLLKPYTENGEEATLLFSVRFGEGSSIYFNPKESVDISNWVITVSCSLAELCVTAYESDDPDLLYEKYRAAKEVKRVFRLENSDGTIPEYQLDQPTKIEAGDYSIYRLFAAISESNWKSPVWEYSTVPGPNGSRPILKWMEEKSTNEALMRKVKDTLAAWAEANQTSAFFTLGLMLRLPNPNDPMYNPEKPTYVPYAVRLLNYPYIDPGTYAAQISMGKEPRGRVGEDYNCLVFGETVGRRPLPKQKLLSYGGNLASPGNPSNNINEVQGSFVLDHRLFFKKHILECIQEVCMGAMIVPVRPRLDLGGNCQAQFSVGAPPKGITVLGQCSGKAPPVIANDEFYALKHIKAGNYMWTERFVAPGSNTDTFYHSQARPCPLYRHWNTWSEQSVTVTWSSAGHVFTVSCETIFNHFQAYSPRSVFSFRPMEPSEGYWGEYKIIVRWSFQIDLTVPQTRDPKTNKVELGFGVVEPTIRGIDEQTNLPEDWDVHLDNQKYDIDNFWKTALDAIRTSCTERIQSIGKSLRAKFRSTGRFVYPATGTFEYSQPMIADNGDVYADVKYQPLRKGLVGIRLPKLMPYTDPTHKIGTITAIPTNPTVFKTSPLLVWSVTIESYHAQTGRLRIKMRANNPCNRPIAFQRVIVSALVMHYDDTIIKLFEEDDLNWKEEAPPTPPELASTNIRVHLDVETSMSVPLPKDNDTSAILAQDREIKLPLANPANPASKPASEPASDPASDPADKPKPQPDSETDELPDPTWCLKSEYIEQQMKVTVQTNINLEFKISPSKATKHRPRFILISYDSFFELTLDSITPHPSEYILQFREIWESPDIYDSINGEQWADTFYKVTLTQSENGTSKGVTQIVTHEVAEEIQGIKNKK